MRHLKEIFFIHEIIFTIMCFVLTILARVLFFIADAEDETKAKIEKNKEEFKALYNTRSEG